MDCIFIEGLKVFCNVGIYDYEKQKDQPLLIDCTIYYDNKKAGLTDNYDSVIDYAKLCAEIESLLQSEHIDLVETVAEKIATLVLGKYHVEKIEVKVNKPEAVPNAKAIGVKIERFATK